jgi:hypothetical protein
MSNPSTPTALSLPLESESVPEPAAETVVEPVPIGRSRQPTRRFDPGTLSSARAWVGALTAPSVFAGVFQEIAPTRLMPFLGCFALACTVGAVVGEYMTDATGRFDPTDDANMLVASLHDAPPILEGAAIVGKGPANLLAVVRNGLLSTWMQAIDAERLDLESVFDDGRAAIKLVRREDVPEGSLVRRSDMLCDVKRGGNLKCRWVNDGSLRGETPAHVRETTTYSPCALSESVLLLFALSAFFSWCPITRDVTKAFLQSDAHKRYYVRLPPGFSAYLRYKHDGEMPFDPSAYLGLVVKNMYGDEDAARLWCVLYSTFLCDEVGCSRSPIDPMLFVLRRGPLVALHVAHVDDGLTTGDPELVEYLDARIAARFPSKRTDGKSFDFVGVEYKRFDDGRIHVNQSLYAAKLVAQFGYADARPASTPLVQGFTALGALEAARGLASTVELDFAAALGGVGFLTRTRPGLKYIYGVLTTVARPSLSCPSAPTAGHYRALARGLRYIKGTLDRGLLFDGARGLELAAYKDASFAHEIATDAKGNGKSAQALWLCFAARRSCRRRCARFRSRCQPPMRRFMR